MFHPWHCRIIYDMALCPPVSIPPPFKSNIRSIRSPFVVRATLLNETVWTAAGSAADQFFVSSVVNYLNRRHDDTKDRLSDSVDRLLQVRDCFYA